MQKRYFKSMLNDIEAPNFKWQSILFDLEMAFKQNPNGMNWNAYISTCIDQAVVASWNLCTNTTQRQNICIMAVGGYGRGISAPYSDVDIVFLCADPEGVDIHLHSEVIQGVVQSLWDMGFKVGQSVHTPDSLYRAMQDDIVLETSVLTHRYIVGDNTVYKTFLDKIPSDLPLYKVSAFMNKKLQEQKSRYKKFGKSQYILEPDIKESKGAIRDLDTVFWICKYAFPRIQNIADLPSHIDIEEIYVEGFQICMEFFLKIRTAIHLISKKPSNILYFDMQQQVAEVMGYQDTSEKKAVEVLMGEYYRHVSKTEIITKGIIDVIRNYVSVRMHMPLPDRVLQKFPQFSQGVDLCENAIYIHTDDVFYTYPETCVFIFEMAQKYDYDIHSKSLVSIQNILKNIDVQTVQTDLVYQSFLRILLGKNSDNILYYMNITQALSCILPEWQGIYCQMQYNMYHDYTTDAHTIRAIGELQDIQSGKYKDTLPVVSQIAQNIQNNAQSNRILYMAVLLHDIAKGLGGDHSILGADIAYDVCKRMGLNQLSAETVKWLVKHHLLLSKTAERRDISDLKTIHDFTKIVYGVHVLDLLMVLTTVDVRSVGQRVWTPWKQKMMVNLYQRAKQHLMGDALYADRDILLPKIQNRLSDIEGIEHIISTLSDAYLMNTPDSILDWHMLHIAKADDWCIHIYEDTVYNNPYIMLFTRHDRIGITAHLTNILASLHIDVIAAEVFNLHKVGILSTFRVHSVHGYSEQQLSQKMEVMFTQPMAIRHRPTILRSRNHSFDVSSRVVIDNQASYHATMIEVHTKDRMGVLSAICNALSEMEINICTARIASYGEWVCDVFYVQDKYGFKIRRQQATQRIENSLYQVLQKLDMT